MNVVYTTLVLGYLGIYTLLIETLKTHLFNRTYT